MVTLFYPDGAIRLPVSMGCRRFITLPLFLCTVRESAVLPFYPLSTTTITVPIGYLPWGKFLTQVHAQLPVLLLGGES